MKIFFKICEKNNNLKQPIKPKQKINFSFFSKFAEKFKILAANQTNRKRLTFVSLLPRNISLDKFCNRLFDNDLVIFDFLIKLL